MSACAETLVCMAIPISDRMRKLATEAHVLAFAVLESGEAIRVHACTMARGTPRRQRRTWIVGYGIGEEGIAYGGGNCHATRESALAAFWRRVGEGRGVVLTGEDL